MHVDPTTLADLAVFGSPDGTAGVFQLVDRTSSESGRKALRRRLEHPVSDAAELRRIQDAVRFLAAQPRLVQLSDRAMESVERYLHSNIEVASRSGLRARVEHAWMSLRHRDLIHELRAGIEQTTALLVHLRALARSIDDRAPPDQVAGLTRILKQSTEAVLQVTSRPNGLLTIDHAYRQRLRGDVELALSAAAELDALNGIGRATAELGWVMPEIVESETFLLEVTGGFHPLLRNPVPNDVRISGGQRMIFLTGPNMAGKTTYLRTAGLIILLAQIGMGVPAASARITPVEALLTSLNPSDNLKAGLSQFLAEVRRVKDAAALLVGGRRSLVLFDEVFKGSNVKDAFDASAEVMLGFARSRRSGFIFASHLSELAEVLRAQPAIRFLCFEGELKDEVAHFSYQLRDGVSDRRLGLFLLRQEGVPGLIAKIPEAQADESSPRPTEC